MEFFIVRRIFGVPCYLRMMEGKKIEKEKVFETK
jgi:hypothetical protein